MVYRCVRNCRCYFRSLRHSKCWLSEERFLPTDSTMRILKKALPSNETIIWLYRHVRMKGKSRGYTRCLKMGWIDIMSLPYDLFCFKEREYIIGIQRMLGRPHVSSLTAIWMESDSGGRHGKLSGECNFGWYQRSETALLHGVRNVSYFSSRKHHFRT
jgi:hypothetical protein